MKKDKMKNSKAIQANLLGELRLLALNIPEYIKFIEKEGIDELSSKQPRMLDDCLHAVEQCEVVLHDMLMAWPHPGDEPFDLEDVKYNLMHRLIELGTDRAKVEKKATVMIGNWMYVQNNSVDERGYPTIRNGMDEEVIWLLDFGLRCKAVS
jgi:hypothetical protein